VVEVGGWLLAACLPALCLMFENCLLGFCFWLLASGFFWLLACGLLRASGFLVLVLSRASCLASLMANGISWLMAPMRFEGFSKSVFMRHSRPAS
jgi:hypothetical protein